MSQVNFILTKGEPTGLLTPGYRRAIKSAKVHGVPIVLWYCEATPPHIAGLDVELRPLDIPAWLVAQNQAHIFDVLAYHIGYKHGGLVLGLDTISIRPALDLFNYCRHDCDVIVSTDWAPGDSNCGRSADGRVLYPYNNNFMAKRGSDGALALFTEAKRRLLHEPEVWGYTGPILLTQFVEGQPKKFAAAPYPALCGWSPGYVWRFYLGLEQPDPGTRVIHLCRTAYAALWDRRYEDWARENPAYAGEVGRRTDVNDPLLSL